MNGTIAIGTEIELAIAHRLPGHSGKCQQLHGHNYVLQVEVGGTIQANGMIMDFADLAGILAELKEMFDHRTILINTDTTVSDPSCMRVSWIPTVENMIRVFTEFLDSRLPSGRSVKSAILHETGKCFARYSSRMR